MQVSQRGTMASTLQFITMSIIYHQANNIIGDRGCLFLGKGYWPNLKELDLMLNSITDNGVANLAKAEY